MLTSEGIAIFYGSRLTAGGRGYINELSPSAQQGQLGLQVSGGTTGGVCGRGEDCAMILRDGFILSKSTTNLQKREATFHPREDSWGDVGRRQALA